MHSLTQHLNILDFLNHHVAMLWVQSKSILLQSGIEKWWAQASCQQDCPQCCPQLANQRSKTTSWLCLCFHMQISWRPTSPVWWWSCRASQSLSPLSTPDSLSSSASLCVSPLQPGVLVLLPCRFWIETPLSFQISRSPSLKIALYYHTFCWIGLSHQIFHPHS